MNDAVENSKKALEDTFTEAENYFESVQGKKCLQDSDCAAISYCDGKYRNDYLQCVTIENRQGPVYDMK